MSFVSSNSLRVMTGSIEGYDDSEHMTSTRDTNIDLAPLADVFRNLSGA